MKNELKILIGKTIEQELNNIFKRQDKKLIELQKEYIKLLEDELSKITPIAIIHHYEVNKDDINKGEMLRTKIKTCLMI